MKSLLVNPTAEEKTFVQEWVKEYNDDMVFYVYNNDDDISWLLNVASITDSIYFNVDNTTDISYNYISYLIANPKVTYKSLNLDYSLINQNRTYEINEYIQRNWMD